MMRSLIFAACFAICVLVKRCVSTLLILSTLCDAFPATTFALGLLFASPVLAASGDAQAPLGDNACGSTVEANLAAARKALQSDDKTTRATLGCLIAATNALNERVRSLEQSRPLCKVNVVPGTTFQSGK
jgi:hypothetical protein